MPAPQVLPQEPNDPTVAGNFFADDPASEPQNEPVIVIGDDEATTAYVDTHVTPAVDEAVEQEARSMGWAPREEWRGPKDKWVDASKFVERGRTILPILNSQLARVREENRELREQLAALNEWKSGFVQEQETGRAEVTRQTLLAHRRQALEEQNWDAVNQIDEKLLDLKVKTPAKVEKPKPQVDPEAQRILVTWASRNPWLQKNETLQTAMLRECTELRRIGDQSTGEAFLDRAYDRVKRLYPEYFPRRRSAPLGDAGGSTGAGGSVRSYAALKPEYRAQCDKMVRNKELTKEQFVAECDPDAFTGA